MADSDAVVSLLVLLDEVEVTVEEEEEEEEDDDVVEDVDRVLLVLVLLALGGVVGTVVVAGVVLDRVGVAVVVTTVALIGLFEVTAIAEIAVASSVGVQGVYIPSL